MTGPWTGYRAMPRQALARAHAVMLGLVACPSPVDAQEGSSVLRALTNRVGRSDVILDRGVRTGLGQVEFPDGGVGGDAQGAQGSSCPGSGCADRGAPWLRK